MDDSSDDGAAVLAHATPRRHGWASVHTPIDWSSAASLRAELARVDARRATLLNALAALEDGVEALNNSSSDEESCCDLTQATAGDQTPPPDSDEDLVDLTQSRVRARDAPTPARDGASSSSDDDDGNNEADVRRGAPEIFVASSLDTSIARRHAIAAASSRCLIRAGARGDRAKNQGVAGALRAHFIEEEGRRE